MRLDENIILGEIIKMFKKIKFPKFWKKIEIFKISKNRNFEKSTLKKSFTKKIDRTFFGRKNVFQVFFRSFRLTAPIRDAIHAVSSLENHPEHPGSLRSVPG